MPNDEVKLAGCPFCGAPGAVTALRDMYWGYCSNDDCAAEVSGKPTRELAAAEWNRRAIPSTVSGETGWQDIASAPFGQRIDLWLWSVDSEGRATEGFRFPEVELVGGVPYPFKYWTDDIEPDLYWPDQNGQFVSHWRPVPASPANPAETQAVEVGE